MPRTDTTPTVSPSEVFPVALPNGTPGTIFVRIAMKGIVESDTDRPAYLGPFETTEDATGVGERIVERPAARSYEIVDAIDPEVLYFPVDRAFMANENLVEAMEYATFQTKATLATGDFEQWRDDPDAAAAFCNYSTRAERAAQKEREDRERTARALAADVNAYRRVKAMLDAGEITQADIDATP